MVCLGISEDSFSKKIDVISARGQFSQLQQRLECVETQQKRARIEHDRDIANVRKDREVYISDMAWHS